MVLKRLRFVGLGMDNDGGARSVPIIRGGTQVICIVLHIPLTELQVVLVSIVPFVDELRVSDLP